MKVVIYGGSGFIGSWITKFLLNNNFQITIFDKKTNKDFLNRIIGQNVEKINFVEGDICLLYTSPSPRDRISSRMPSSA